MFGVKRILIFCDLIQQILKVNQLMPTDVYIMGFFSYRATYFGGNGTS